VKGFTPSKTVPFVHGTDVPDVPFDDRVRDFNIWLVNVLIIV